jgi:septal ring factor EnvC (AmiA/AmiB activator)
MNCRYCGAEIAEHPGGHRRREYCNRACKQADYRKRQSQIQQPADNQAQARILELEHQLADSKEDIKELEQQIMRLRNRLDLERRYYESKPYSFKAWLKKHLPQTEFTRRVLADQLFMPRDTRAHYEYYMRRVKYSQDDIQEFTELWRLMLLSTF